MHLPKLCLRISSQTQTLHNSSDRKRYSQKTAASRFSCAADDFFGVTIRSRLVQERNLNLSMGKIASLFPCVTRLFWDPCIHVQRQVGQNSWVSPRANNAIFARNCHKFLALVLPVCAFCEIRKSRTAKVSRFVKISHRCESFTLRKFAHRETFSSVQLLQKRFPAVQNCSKFLQKLVKVSHA